MRMRLLGAATAVVLAIALAAPAGGATARHYAPRLSSMVLSLDQMPVGWNAAQAPGPSWFSDGWRTRTRLARAGRGFRLDDSRLVTEGIGEYGGAKAKSAYRWMLQGVAGLGFLSTYLGLKPTKKTAILDHLSRMSFPRLGDASTAWDGPVAKGPIPLIVAPPSAIIKIGNLDEVIARKGHFVVMLVEVGSGAFTAQFEHFAKLAIAKVR